MVPVSSPSRITISALAVIHCAAPICNSSTSRMLVPELPHLSRNPLPFLRKRLHLPSLDRSWVFDEQEKC